MSYEKYGRKGSNRYEAKLLNQGLCLRCRNPSVPKRNGETGRWCQAHMEFYRKYQRNYYHRVLKAKDELMSYDSKLYRQAKKAGKESLVLILGEDQKDVERRASLVESLGLVPVGDISQSEVTGEFYQWWGRAITDSCCDRPGNGHAFDCPNTNVPMIDTNSSNLLLRKNAK